MAAKYSVTITTRAGTVLSNVKVQALDSNGVAQTLYTDVGLTTASTPESTAVYSNEEGLAEFYVADGTYTIVHTYRSTTKTFANVELYDLSNLKQLSSDLASTASGKGAGMVKWLSSLVGSVARWVSDKLSDTVSVKDFGAVGDGVTDDRAAIAAAVSAARGRKILFPKGNYLINTDGGSITDEEIDLAGENVLDGATGSIDQGVNIWITGTTNSPFKVRRGVSSEGIGYYHPNQTDSATPDVYPAIFKGDYTNGAIQFLNFKRNVVYNAYKFLEFDDGTSGNIGHVEIEGNYICALNRAIYISHNLEHIRINGNNFTFGFWLAATEAGARAYMRANATAIQLDKTDGVKIFDNLFYGYLNGVLTSATGNCQRIKIHSNEFDAVRYPIKASGSGRLSASIIGNTFNSYNDQDTSLQGRSISIETTGAGQEIVEISGNSFELATEDHIYVADNTPTRIIVVGTNTYISWAHGKSSGAYGALNINGSLTNVNLTGGRMKGGNNTPYSYGVMGTFNSLECSGVNFESCQRALSVSVGDYTATGNRSSGTAGTYSDTVTATRTNYAKNNNWDKPKVWSVASAAALNITGLGRFITVTGTTNITSITVDVGASLPGAGEVIYLLFSGVLTLTDGNNLKLGGNFVTSADDVIALVSDGTNFYQIAPGSAN